MIWYLAKDNDSKKLAWLHTKKPEFYNTYWHRKKNAQDHHVISIDQTLPIVSNLKPGDLIAVSVRLEEVKG